LSIDPKRPANIDNIYQDNGVHGVMMRGVLLSLGLLLAGVGPAQTDGPDYAGAVALMKGSLKESLTEQSPCVFRSEAPVGRAVRIFHAGALEVVASAASTAGVQFDCRKQSNCVTTGEGRQSSTITFIPQDDPTVVAGAISRVVEMCSGAGHK
jgi:hypothetical protein